MKTEITEEIGTKQQVRTSILIGGFFVLLAAVVIGVASLNNTGKREATDQPTAIQEPFKKPHDASQKPEYLLGQLLVQTTSDARATMEAYADALTQGGDPRELERSPLSDINQQFAAQKIESVIRSTTTPEAVTAANPQRVQRKPRGVTVPDLHDWFLLTFPKDTDLSTLQRSYESLEEVRAVSLNYQFRTNAIQQPRVFPPNDPYYASSGAWGQNYRDLWGLQQIGIETAWGSTIGNQSIVVAISDTGVDYNHEDIRSSIWVNTDEVLDGIDNDNNGYIDDVRGWDFTTCAQFGWIGCITPKPTDNDPMDGYGHGTHVAGTVGATTNNRLGIAGINWRVQVMPVQGLNTHGVGSLSDLVNTIVYATDNGADVINMSWGGASVYVFPPILREALDYAYGHGVVLVAAAGNSDNNLDTFIQSPSHYPNLLSVAASNHVGGRASYSNYGSEVAITAPGGDGDGDSWIRLADEEASYQTYRSSQVVGAFSEIDLSIFVFSDPRVTLQTAVGPDAGTVIISADGATVTSFDLYAPTPGFTEREFIVPATNARLRFTIGTESNPQSMGHTVALDGFWLWSFGNPFVINESIFWFSDGPIDPTKRNILSLRAAGTDMYGDGLSLVGSKYYRSRGTSMAAPHVAGVVALLLAKNPTWNAEQVEAALEQGATDVEIYGAGWDPYTGAGILHAARALAVQDPLIGIMTSPATGAIIARSASVAIRGTVMGGGFQRYTLEYGIGNQPTSWAPIGKPHTAAVPEINGLLGEWDTSQFPADRYTVRLVVTGAGGQQLSRTASLHVGVEPGWGQFLEGEFWQSFSVGDLDGDGMKELVGAEEATQKAIFVWKPDGTIPPGWPKSVAPAVPSQPALADLDHDNKDDVLFLASQDGSTSLVALNGQGETLPGFPMPVAGNGFGYSYIAPVIADLDGNGNLDILIRTGWPGAPVSRYEYVLGPNPLQFRWTIQTSTGFPLQPTVGDVTGDGTPDIVVVNNHVLLVVDRNGQTLPGWPRSFPDTGFYIPAVVGDISGDSASEIVVQAFWTGLTYAFDGTGNLVPGAWPVAGRVNMNGYEAKQVLADIDQDGKNEVIANRYILDGDGSTISSWTLGADYPTGPVVADIDADGVPEVLFETASEWVVGAPEFVVAYEVDGTPITELPTMRFPLEVRGIPMTSPVIDDFEHDGILDLVLPAQDSYFTEPGFFLYKWRLGPTGPLPASEEWRVLDHDAQHTNANSP